MALRAHQSPAAQDGHQCASIGRAACSGEIYIDRIALSRGKIYCQPAGAVDPGLRLLYAPRQRHTPQGRNPRTGGRVARPSIPAALLQRPNVKMAYLDDIASPCMPRPRATSQRKLQALLSARACQPTHALSLAGADSSATPSVLAASTRHAPNPAVLALTLSLVGHCKALRPASAGGSAWRLSTQGGACAPLPYASVPAVRESVALQRRLRPRHTMPVHAPMLAFVRQWGVPKARSPASPRPGWM